MPFLGASKTATGYQAVFGYIFGYTKTSSSSATNGATYQYCEASDTSYWSDKYYHYYIPASLKNVTITGGKIGENAFYNCSGLTNISIPNSITTIGEKAFCNCSSLSSIVIGNKVNSIGIEAFNECSSLTSVYYKGTSTDRLNISIDSNNQALTNATWFYYKATEPNLNANGTAYNGNYWRYVDGVATPWVYGKEN